MQWRAPHFVWQVRTELARILCPGQAGRRVREDRHGRLPRHDDARTGTCRASTEKWVYAAARAPNLKGTDTIWDNLKISSADQGWLRNLRGKNIHNGAAAVIDYRTGEVLAYVGSGSYTSPGNEKFQPQYDVLSDGWRQPGSSIKPINYAIGIDDRTMTAATMFMDVMTDFGGGFTPTQADDLERGPVRLRSALQFSLNIPSIKAGVINGLDHFYERSKDFGIQYIPGSVPVVSMGIGTLEVHPIDLLGAYGAIANGGVLMPRTTILERHRLGRQPGLPGPDDPDPEAARGRQPPGRLHHHRHPGGQHEHEGQPVLGRVGGLQRQAAAGRPPTRPARRTTTATPTRTATSPRRRIRACRRWRSGSGWATATTSRTPTRCRWPRRRPSGRGSCAT